MTGFRNANIKKPLPLIALISLIIVVLLRN